MTQKIGNGQRRGAKLNTRCTADCSNSQPKGFTLENLRAARIGGLFKSREVSAADKSGGWEPRRFPLFPLPVEFIETSLRAGS